MFSKSRNALVNYVLIPNIELTAVTIPVSIYIRNIDRGFGSWDQCRKLCVKLLRKTKKRFALKIFIKDAIKTVEKHSSIRKIKGHMHHSSVFRFDYVIREVEEK